MSKVISSFDENLVCESCGKKGAFDIYGDYICEQCLEKEEHHDQ